MSTRGRPRCIICNEKFNTSEELLDHLFLSRDKRHSNFTRSTIVCPLCQKKAQGWNGLLDHIIKGCGETLNIESSLKFLERRKSPEDLKLRFEYLLEKGTDLMQVWIVGTRHPNPVIRKMSAIAIGRLKDERGLKSLIDLLNDSNPEVVKSAIRALGRLESRRGIAVVIRLLKNNDKSIVNTAANVLIKSAQISEEMLLTSLFEEKEEDEEWKTIIIRILLKINPENIEKIRERFHEFKYKQRIQILQYLHKTSSDIICNLLLMTLMDPIPAVKNQAMELLRQQEKKCKDQLIQALIDKDSKLWSDGLKYAVRVSETDDVPAHQTSVLGVQQELKDILEHEPWKLGVDAFITFTAHSKKPINYRCCRITTQKERIIITLANGEQLKISIQDILTALKNHNEISADTLPELGKVKTILPRVLKNIHQFWKKVEVLAEYEVYYSNKRGVPKLILKSKRSDR